MRVLLTQWSPPRGCHHRSQRDRAGGSPLRNPQRTHGCRVIVVHDLLPRRRLRRAAILFIEHFAQMLGHEILFRLRRHVSMRLLRRDRLASRPGGLR